MTTERTLFNQTTLTECMTAGEGDWLQKEALTKRANENILAAVYHWGALFFLLFLT